MQSYYEKYLKYKTKYLNLTKMIAQEGHFPVQEGGGNEKPTIYLFKAEWCGHCKGFKPTWEKIQKDLKNKYEFITIDSEKDKAEISQWGIKGFPTIIKKISDNAEEYVGPRDEISVKEFIEKN